MIAADAAPSVQMHYLFACIVDTTIVSCRGHLPRPVTVSADQDHPSALVMGIMLIQAADFRTKKSCSAPVRGERARLVRRLKIRQERSRRPEMRGP